jgi:hypothetical protein
VVDEFYATEAAVRWYYRPARHGLARDLAVDEGGSPAVGVKNAEVSHAAGFRVTREE